MTKIKWQRAVIKVGSALVSPQGTGCSDQYLAAIASFIINSKQQNKEVILVSSGSVSAARHSIKSGHRATIAEKQAMAAVGQTKMMANWTRLFNPGNQLITPSIRNETQAKNAEKPAFECAQILVTVEDLANRKRFVNIKNTIETLLKNNIIPIVNENDTVAVDEIKVGDNDNLAAHTAIATQADCLIICTDVDGLYTANPRLDPSATLIPQVNVIDDEIMSLAGGAGTAIGTGGMITKLQAAQKCTRSGIQTILINGTRPENIETLSSERYLGTLFKAQSLPRRARRDWLIHTSKIRGSLSIDIGAANALQNKGASLLAVGVRDVSGKFAAGDSVEIVHNDKVYGKGISNYSSTETRRILGKKSAEIEYTLGYFAGEEIVHRDNLVIDPSAF